MKTLRCGRRSALSLTVAVGILTCGAKAPAQTADSNTVPIVTVKATQAFATVTHPGVFTVFRAGNTNLALSVWYNLAGTASNGLDYALIPPHLVSIAAGALSNTIVIRPLTNPPPTSAARTVVLQLTNSPLMSPVNYQIGSPSSAVVYIGPSPTNKPPVVRIVSPANGSVFSAPINIPIYAFAHDPDGRVGSVQFFAGTNSLGFGKRIPVPLALTNPAVIFPDFYLLWSNAPVGKYVLTAVATDNDGASTISAPVNITILPGPPPPTNRPPIVCIVATDPVAIKGTNSWTWRGETNSPPTWETWPTAICRAFTNCGPKTASFLVRRFGVTNEDLTVAYHIGGTASNGVDYVALPGSVTIPAGKRGAFITIVPIDDGSPDINKTVLLALIPSTNAPPDYVLGFPRRAAAIIIDHRPTPVSGLLPGGYFHLVAPGPNAAWFCIESSSNLANWTPVCTNQVVNGSIDFIDPDVQGNPSRFYRAVPVLNPF